MAEKIFHTVAGGITAVPGFLAAGLHVGLKKDKPDMAMVFNPTPCTAAGVFTTNAFKAAPLWVTMEYLKQGQAHGVVINSGNANACTGPQGMKDAKAMALAAGEALNVAPEKMLVASTGVIGVPMPMDKIIPGIALVAEGLSAEGGHNAAHAIMTTDTIVKEKAIAFSINGQRVTIGGMAKGSGMIHPNMATMLCYLTTDALIDPVTLRRALKEAVNQTFNMITVDGDTSTNDSVIILASGEAQNPAIEGDTPQYKRFVVALTGVCRSLAQSIARDGEGATALLEINVKNAASEQDAALVARSVAGSNLFKAAVFGKDANWGRIICAVGYSGAKINPDTVDIYIDDLPVAKDGGGLLFDEEKAIALLSGEKVVINIDLKDGTSKATAWGCDLTYDYVRINGSYRT